MKIIDLNTWIRKPYFDFFNEFDEPFFGINAEIDCSTAYKKAKESNASFFASYLHKAIKAANEIEEFRLRIIDDKVVVYDVVHASPTLGRSDETFSFGFIPYDKELSIFSDALAKEIGSIQSISGLNLNENTGRDDLIHFSSIPWIHFKGVSHVRNYNSADSIPKITFGKAISQNEKLILPIAIHVHHGLMDAIHVARYLNLFQDLMRKE